jgi:hypothetical protein
MMNIETLIADAKARQDARTEAHREELEQRAYQAGDVLRNQFIAAFGDDMLTLLDGYVSSPFDDVARITFRYQKRDYSIRRRYSDGVCDWVLTWLAPRDDDDDRRLPSVAISESRRDDQANIDELVLALADLADLTDEPRQPRRVLDQEPRKPTAEERLIAALHEIMRDIAADSHDM